MLDRLRALLDTLSDQGALSRHCARRAWEHECGRYLGWSEDIFRSPSGGAFINNNPGASLTAAIPLFLLRPLLIRVDSGAKAGRVRSRCMTTENYSGGHWWMAAYSIFCWWSS